MTGSHPNGGVGPKMWTGSGVSGYSLITRPASPVVLRFYRSLEGYSYTDPRCVVGCAPVSMPGERPTVGVPAPGWVVFSSAAGPSQNLAFFNYAAVLIKRVSSSAWLELRWNALDHAMAVAENPAVTNAPYAFELWCSHTAVGGATTTRLATWDYKSVAPATVNNVPFDASVAPMYLEANLINNVVSWALWSEYPGTLNAPADSTSKIESGSYALPSALFSIVGSSVGGSPGASLRVDNPTGSPGVGYAYTDAWAYTALNVPFVHYLEFEDANNLLPLVEVPFIGDADDTPPRIVIYGMLVDPVIAFLTPQEDGSYSYERVILEGTIGDGDAITIDLEGGGSITDDQGNNRYDMLRAGSHLPMLKPGVNKVVLAAINWNESLDEHISIAWRDALR